MRVGVHFKPWQLPFLALFAVISVLAGLKYWRDQLVSPEMLQRYLPPQVGSIFYCDVAALANAGVLGRLLGPPGGEEADYVRFVQEIGFDYQRDLRSVLFGIDGETTYVLATGLFDWAALRSYAESRNGVCRFSVCRMPLSRGGRFVSWGPLHNDIIALAIGPDQWAAAMLMNRTGTSRKPVAEPAPVWMSSTGAALAKATTLPAGTKTFTRVLESADRILLSITAGTGSDLQIRLQADCPRPDVATRMASELTQGTATLNALLAQENRRPNPADLSGVLSAGSFRADANRVTGAWPLPRSFVEALAVPGR